MMKRRLVCSMLAFLMSIVSLETWFSVQISATTEENVNAITEESLLLYDQIIMGVGDVYEPQFRFDVDEY